MHLPYEREKIRNPPMIKSTSPINFPISTNILNYFHILKICNKKKLPNRIKTTPIPVTYARINFGYHGYFCRRRKGKGKLCISLYHHSFHHIVNRVRGALKMIKITPTTITALLIIIPTMSMNPYLILHI